MKTTILLLMLCFAGTPSFAQFQMSGGDVDLGIRSGALFANKIKNVGPNEKYHASAPSIGFTWDVGVSNWGLSFGGDLNYAVFKADKSNTPADGHTKMTSLQFIVNVKYYPAFLTIGKLAPYLRLDAVPLAIWKTSGGADVGDHGIRMVNGLYVAANYQLADQIGVFAEAGLGYTKFNAGIMLRVKDN